MSVIRSTRRAAMLLPSALLLLGCQSPARPLDLGSFDPTLQQSTIAGYHANEATFFKLKAQELHQRIMVYDNLFGPDSDWVRGARLLARFYEESAEEQERLSRAHQGLTDRQPSPVIIR